MRAPEEKFGQIITFYSYKGGTGRSMAMANVGYLLATSPVHAVARVLLIDWDLEAPGLPRFFRDEFTGDGPAAYPLRDAPGLIDFLTDVAAHYREHAPTDELPEREASNPRARELYESATAQHPFANYVQQSPKLPKLHLVTAGNQSATDQGDAYADRVRAFDWAGFYHQYGSFFTFFRDELMRSFDYVLIDSRTGLTDTGGICTRVMPEKLVAVFVPNRQNIDGVSGVIRQAVSYRRRSRDVRGLAAFPLASRIDASNQRLRQVWWQGGAVDGETIEGYQPTFERLLKELYELNECELGDYFNATQVPHDSDYAFGESIAARHGTSDRFSIGGACYNLVERLVRLDGPWEEMEDLLTQYTSARSSAEEHARRAAALEAELEQGRRRNRSLSVLATFAVLVAVSMWTTFQLGFGLTQLLYTLVGTVVAVGLVVLVVRQMMRQRERR